MNFSTSCAVAMVRSISAEVWEAEMKAASNCGRRKEDASVEHFAEIVGVALRVGALGPGVIGDRIRREEDGGK